MTDFKKLEAQESDDSFGEESSDLSSDLDFTFEDP